MSVMSLSDKFPAHWCICLPRWSHAWFPRHFFLNFFNLWGLIEIKQDKISQTAHLCGVIAGIIISVLLKNEGPQPKIYDYEIEEELEKKNNINYIYKKKN